MDETGRADHIEDVLITLHTGQWFGWSDSKNKVYANLIIHKPEFDKPTEKSLTDALATMQSEHDAQEYVRNRRVEYPDWSVQLEKIYDDGLTKWKSEMVDPVKTKWPKDNSGPIE